MNEVYMKQPMCLFTHLFRGMSVNCKIKYGLKQVPHAWFHHFNSFLLSHDVACSHVAPSMLISLTDTHILVLFLYVDDIVMTENTGAIFKSSLHFFLRNL